MSTTVTTSHHRVPWLASAAVVAVLAGAGLVGVAWENSGSSASHQAPVLRTPTAQDYTQYRHYYPGGDPYAGLDGHVPPAPPLAAAGGPQAHVPPAPAPAEGGLDGHVPPAPPIPAEGGLDGHVPPAPPAADEVAPGHVSPPPATTSGGRVQIAP
jgi:hypothetical protein